MLSVTLWVLCVTSTVVLRVHLPLRTRGGRGLEGIPYLELYGSQARYYPCLDLRHE